MISKSANFISKALESRSGLEVYQEVFGKSDSDCSKILHYQDKEIPIIDFAIVLHFTTCAGELERILKAHDFSKSHISTSNWDGNISTGVELDWLIPREMGDTIVVYEYSTFDNQYVKTIWTSMDGTEVYCRLIN